MNFINKIQNRLLLRYPIIWSSLIVPVLLFSGLINVILFLIFYFASSPYDYNSYGAWIPFLALSGGIAGILYLIFLLRFNKFKIFGKLKWYDFAAQYVLYFIAFGSILLWPFIPQVAGHVAIKGNFSEAEMRKDFKDAYILANQLEYKESTAPYRKIKIFISDTVTYEQEDRVNNTIIVPDETYLDRSSYVKMDKISDSEYVAMERISLVCSSYPYNLDVDNGTLTDDIYESLGRDKLNDEQKRKKLAEIFDKYIPGNDGKIYRESFTDGIYGFTVNDDENSVACQKYKLSELGNNLEHVSTKIIHDRDWEVFIRIWFYMTLVISTLVVIYRHMSLRTYLWTFLFTFLLFVLSIIIAIAMRFDEIGITGLMLFYYILFAIVASTIFFSKSRNVFQGIALNLSFFCLFFLPMVSSVFYWELFDVHTLYKDEYLKITEMAGGFLVLISALFFHARLFYKWYSLPEE